MVATAAEVMGAAMVEVEMVLVVMVVAMREAFREAETEAALVVAAMEAGLVAVKADMRAVVKVEETWVAVREVAGVAEVMTEGVQEGGGMGEVPTGVSKLRRRLKTGQRLEPT